MASYRVVVTALQLAALLHCAASVTRVDETRVEGAKGTDVVIATVNKITESGIFSDDYQFLRRMAAVETEDGEAAIFGNGGIWNVDKEDVFTEVQEFMLTGEGQSTLGIDIETTFYFNWIETIKSIKDLDTPLYSALAVMIHIEMSRAEMVYEIPHGIQAQAMIWKDHFNEDGDLEDFIKTAEQLQREGNDYCSCI